MYENWRALKSRRFLKGDFSLQMVYEGSMWRERSLLKQLLSRSERATTLAPTGIRPSVIVPNGYDSAVLQINGQLAVSIDSIIEHEDFSLAYFEPWQVGAKAVESAFSDVVAVGSFPRYALVALALPRAITEAVVLELNSGIERACTRLNAALIGGDISATGDALCVTVTALGIFDKGCAPCLRSGAKAGDLVFVTGELGGSGAGLLALQRGYDGYQTIKRAHREPRCRSDIVHEVAPLASAMIDISDGLASEIRLLCEASSCGAVLFEDAIPLNEETKKLAELEGLNPYSFAYSGGEDYELLYTTAPANQSRAPGTCIGHLTSDNLVRVQKYGKVFELEELGFEHGG